MSNRPVWALDTPGVDHDPADARRASYTNTAGESGLIVAGGGGLVPTPGDSTKVRILPCSVVAVSRYPGHERQSYQFEVPEALDITIRPAGSAGGRTDAIILRVRDRILEGKVVPEETANDLDYWEPAVLEGVPSAVGWEEDALAAWKGIDYPFVLIGSANMPKNSSAVGNIDFLGNPIHGRSRDMPPQVVSVPSANEIGPTSGAYRNIGPELFANVPTWATRAVVTATVMGAYCRNGSSAGWISGSFAGQNLERTRWDLNVSSGYVRGTYVVAGEVAINSAKRGTVQSFRVRATNEASGSAFGVNSGSAIHLAVHFYENVDMGW